MNSFDKRYAAENTSDRDYPNAEKLLTSAGKFRISLGLERMYAILNLLGNPQDKLNCIHVAGTNGKGSVCAILASVLNEAGKKVGLYTSPHIFKYTERIQLSRINNQKECSLQPITDEEFAHYVFEITNLADKNNIDLTEFEILTAVMFKYFSDNGADVVVLETGLGGRFDATNVIKKNLCSVITHIDYDHTERLGNTLDKIASEKAGIIKYNCPSVVYEGYEAFYDAAKEADAPLELIVPSADMANLALKGSYQQENLALALAALDVCFPNLDDETIQRGLKKVKHQCRFQYIEEKNLIIDGAHNPNGISSLLKSLEMYYSNKKRRFIFGCLRHKDYKKMEQILFSKNDEVYFYHFNNKNSATFEELKAACPISCKELTKETKIDLYDGKLTIICGSFYMIAEITKLLKIKL